MKFSQSKKLIAIALLLIFTLSFFPTAVSAGKKASAESDSVTDLISSEKEVALSKVRKTTYVGKSFSLKLKNSSGKTKWISSNDAIATVEDGKVTALSKGTVTITAKNNNVKYSCNVTVKEPYASCTERRLRYGTSFDFEITGAEVVSYKSSAPKVAKVDANGTVTAGKKGTATITAYCAGGQTFDCNVTVYKNVLDIEDPKFSDLAPTTKMSFEELVGDSGNYNFPVGYPSSDTYRITVDLYHKVVMVHTKDAKGKYTVPVRYMLCSVGASATPTPTGTFKMESYRVRNSIFNNTNSYAQYWSEIVGRIYFHSILYTSTNAKDYTTSSWNNLGNAVSHGCIRLTVPDARWIWYNIAPGTIVEIRKGSASDTATKEIRDKLKLAPLPSVRPNLVKGQIPWTDNWEIEDVPNEVKFVQGSQNNGEAAY